MDKHARITNKQLAIGRGISFAPDLWARVIAEAEEMERPNRSLVIDRALRLYFESLDARTVRAHKKEGDETR